MAPRPRGGLSVETRALRRDATTWAGGDDSMAAAMQSAATAGDTQLAVSDREFSFAGVRVGLVETYEQLRAKAVRLMGEAADNFEAVAEELIRAADEYDRTDGETDAEIRDAWRLQDD